MEDSLSTDKERVNYATVDPDPTDSQSILSLFSYNNAATNTVATGNEDDKAFSDNQSILSFFTFNKPSGSVSVNTRGLREEAMSDAQSFMSFFTFNQRTEASYNETAKEDDDDIPDDVSVKSLIELFQFDRPDPNKQNTETVENPSDMQSLISMFSFGNYSRAVTNASDVLNDEGIRNESESIGIDQQADQKVYDDFEINNVDDEEDYDELKSAEKGNSKSKRPIRFSDMLSAPKDEVDVEVAEETERPVNDRNKFVPDFHLNFDYCIVLPLVTQIGYGYKFTPAAKDLVSRLQVAGITYYPYLNFSKDELFILLRCSLSSLQKFAELSCFSMLLDPEATERIAGEGYEDTSVSPIVKIAPISIPTDKTYSRLSPWEYIYGEYMPNVSQDLYWRPEGLSDPFRLVIRLKLTEHILKSSPARGGCGLNINQLLRDGEIKAVFPLHDREYSRGLLRRWIGFTVFPWSQPFAEINEYFGEKIALYYVFMGKYTTYLFYPALLGVFFQVIVTYTGNFSHPVLPFFGIYISIWARTFVRDWDKVEQKKAMEWGTVGMVQAEEDRPEFKGKEGPSPITGKPIMIFSNNRKSHRMTLAWALVFFSCVLAMISISSLYTLRYYLIHIDEDPADNISSDKNFVLRSPIARYSLFLVSALNGAQSHFYNVAFTLVGMKLTDLENHRTDQEYLDGLIAKTFTFMSVNSYASYFYIAFMWPMEIQIDPFFYHYKEPPEPYVDPGFNYSFYNESYWYNENFTYYPTPAPSAVPTPEPTMNLTAGPVLVFTGVLEGYRADHMMTLALNWGVIFIARAIFQALTELVIPALILTWKQWALYAMDSTDPPTAPEIDYLMEDESVVFGNIQTYGDACMQFGYVSFFITAIPGASTLVLLQNIYKVKADAWRTVKLVRRPVPEPTETVGAWKECFSFLSYIAVITNAALITFSMTTLDERGYRLVERFWIFVGIQWVVFALHYSIAVFTKANKTKDLQIKRQNFIVSKILYREPDDDAELSAEDIHKKDEYSLDIPGYALLPPDANDASASGDLKANKRNDIKKQASSFRKQVSFVEGAKTVEEDNFPVMCYPRASNDSIVLLKHDKF